MRICWHNFVPYEPNTKFRIGCDFLKVKPRTIHLIYKCQKCDVVKSVLDLSLRTCRKLMKKYKD